MGSAPPHVAEAGSEDALESFSRLSEERHLVRRKLESLHAPVAQRFSSSVSPLSFEEGDRVWLRDLPKAEQKSLDKLKRIWQGPYEILRWEGGNCYLVATPERSPVYSIDCLKPYRQALTGDKVRLQYHADIVTPPVVDGLVVHEILGHERCPDPRRRGKKRLFRHVHRKGAEQPTWEPASHFVHHVTDKWLQYTLCHNIQVDCSDVHQQAAFFLLSRSFLCLACVEVSAVELVTMVST